MTAQMRRSSRDVVSRILRYNAGREPERLALKYDAMRKSKLAFFRGTAHLFWEDAHTSRKSLPTAPLGWACGDLHLENFGTFQGDNGLTYFDLNDFDEAALAPITWEVARLLASVYVGASSIRVEPSVISLAQPPAANSRTGGAGRFAWFVQPGRPHSRVGPRG